MKIRNRTINFMIICIYAITCLLGNEMFLGLFDVSKVINYIIVLLPVILILLIILDNRKGFKLKKINKITLSLAILFVTWCIITFIVGINRSFSGVKALIHFSIIILLAILLSKVDFENYQVKKLKKHLFISFFITLAYGIIEYLFNFNLDIYSNDKYPNIRGRVYSTLFIATLFDKYICIMTLILSHEMSNKKNNKSIFYKLLFVMSGICIALTFSRTGFLLYLLILFLFVIHEFINKNMQNVFLSIFTVIILFFIPGVKYSFQSGLNQVYSIIKIDFANKTETSSIKTSTKDDSQNRDNEVDLETDSSKEWRDYYKFVGKLLMKEYPVTGIGIGNYSFIYNNQNVKHYLKNSEAITHHYMYPHSSYVQMGAEIGLIGVIIFYLFVYSIIYNINIKEHKKHFIYMHLFFAIMLAISYVEGIIYSKQFFYIFIIVYALYCNNSFLGSQKSKTLKKGKKKIDILALHLGMGGIETSIKNIANILSKKYEVNIVAFYNLEENIAAQINSNVKISYLCEYIPNKDKIIESIKNKKFIQIIKEMFIAIKILYLKKFLIKKHVMNSDSDVIISTRMEFSTILNEYGKNDIYKIAQEHRYHNNCKKYINTIKYSYDRIDILCSLTNQLKCDYETFLKPFNKYTKVVTVPNMIETKSYKKASLKGNTIITVGRLVNLKKFDDAIDIVNKIDCNYQLIIVGDGEEYDKLNNKINELGLSDKVELIGKKNQKEISNLLSKSSIFIMTSTTEGLPMVLLEAMSTGLPIIAFDYCNSLEDIIEDNKTGFIISNRDKSMFATKLEELLKDKKKQKEFQKNALKNVDKYSSNSIQELWFKILG